MTFNQIEEQFDRPLPAVPDVEQLVLAAGLTDPEVPAQLADLLSSNDFSLPKHQLIYSSIVELHGKGEASNYSSVATELQRKKQLESVGGLSYLVEMAANMPRLSTLEHCCQVLRTASVKRRAIVSMRLLIDRCYNPAEDAADMLADAERVSLLLNASDHRCELAQTIGQVVASAGGLDHFLLPPKKAGIRLPFTAIDMTMSGLRRSKLILLGARPAVGKTALATQIAEHAAASGHTVLFVTLEMSNEDVIRRSLAGRASVNAYKFREGKLSETERLGLLSEITEMSNLDERFLLVDKSEITVQGIGNQLQRLKARGNSADLCVIDYLQLLNSVDRFENRVQEVSAISRGLKRLAQRFEIPVLALSQLTRKEDHRKNDRPELDWLKESGQLEQDADQVLFLWAGKDPEQGDPTRQINWRVAKNRDGTLNQGTLAFQTKYCRFDEDSLQPLSTRRKPADGL